MSQTVRRALPPVEHFSDEPRSLGEMADHLQMHNPTALRLLHTLEECGFARQLADGRYSVGFRIVAIAERSLDAMDLPTVARPHLAALSRQDGHTLHLAHLIQDEIVYVDKLDGRGAVHMQSRVEAPCGVAHRRGRQGDPRASGGAVTQSPPRACHYQRYPASTLTSPQEFRDELEATVARGPAEDDGEFEDFVPCVAVPVWDARGNVRASVSITALTALTSLEVLREYVSRLLVAAEEISRESWTGVRREP